MSVLTRVSRMKSVRFVCIHLLDVKALNLAVVCSESKYEAEAPMMLAINSHSNPAATKSGRLDLILRPTLRIVILLGLLLVAGFLPGNKNGGQCETDQ